jgi:NAD(P)-dependent dehydrogenase (short-subunit alcohol dehydrogenase family)
VTLDVRGKRVLVAGATGGVGPAVVEAFLALGATVIGAARRRTGLDELRAAMGQSDRLECAEADLADPRGVEALFDALERKGPLDVVIHLAGAFAMGPLAELTDDELDRLVGQNLRAAALVLRASLRRMIPRRTGRVLVLAADRALAPAPGVALYGATKAGVAHLVEAAAAEVHDLGIRVNALLPGVIDTAHNRAAMPGAEPSGWVSPQAIAELLVWLAGRGGAAVNGALIRLPGG